MAEHPDLAGLVEEMAQVRRELADLQQLVDVHEEVLLADSPSATSGRPGVGDDPGGPYVWARLDPDAAESLWNRVAGFVDWLNQRYQLSMLRGVPACWFRHGDVVEELTALYAAWRAAYAPDAVDTAAPADWHRNYLAPVLGRLHTDSTAAKCNPGDHRPEVPAQLAAGDDLTDWIRADLNDRPAADPTTSAGH